MKFTIALLLSAVAARRGGGGECHGNNCTTVSDDGDHGDHQMEPVTQEEWETFGPALFNEWDKMYQLPSDSRVRRFWQRYVRGDAHREIRAIHEHVYAEGGPWETAAGDDGCMQYEEAYALNQTMRAGMAEKLGDLPEQTDEEFQWYNSLYNGVSGDANCFTMEDAKYVDRVFERMRRELVEWNPTPEQIAEFRPLFQMELERHMEMDEESAAREFFEGWLNGEEWVERLEHEMTKHVYGDNGPFDQAAGDDGQMDHDEFVAFHDAMLEQMSEMTGEDVEGETDEQLEQIYSVYDNLSDGEGFNKKDAMTGHAIFNKIRDHRITDDEIWAFWTVGEYFMWRFADVIPDEYWGDFEEKMNNPPTQDDLQKLNDYFDQFDEDHNGILNRQEWMHGLRHWEHRMTEEIHQHHEDWDWERFTDYEASVYWHMAMTVQDGNWNRWGHHADHGLNRRSFLRLNRILRRTLQEINDDDGFWEEYEEEMEDEDWEDSDSDSDDHDEDEETNLFLL